MVCAFKNANSDDTEIKHSGIPYSAMQSGQWKIILSGDEIAVQRVLSLTVGGLATVTITVSLELIQTLGVAGPR